MQNKDTNTLVIFSENTAPIISGILQGYNIEETPKELEEAFNANKKFRGEIVLGIVENITLNNISKNDLTETLQKELNISNDIAKKMSVDISEKLLPIARTILRDKYNEARKKAFGTPADADKEKPMTANPIRLIKENQDKDTENIVNPIIKPKEIKVIHEVPKKIKNYAPDSYREPIE